MGGDLGRLVSPARRTETGSWPSTLSRLRRSTWTASSIDSGAATRSLSMMVRSPRTRDDVLQLGVGHTGRAPKLAGDRRIELRRLAVASVEEFSAAMARAEAFAFGSFISSAST